MENNKKFVSIVVPAYNEERYISKCLDSFVRDHYPKEYLELLIVDGGSTDRTKEIVKEYSKKYPFIKLLENPNRVTPFALNIGIKNAKGDMICLFGAHAEADPDYVEKSAYHLFNNDTDCVGGINISTSPFKTIGARAIAAALRSPFGVGGAKHRTENVTKPEYRDTVPKPCYKKEVFEKYGMFNENLVRSQDMEFNIRMRRAGGKILLVPDIKTYYRPKSGLWDFFIHNLEDGVWAVYPMKFVKTPLMLRHYIPLFFVMSLIISGILGIFLPIFFYLFLFVWALYLSVSLLFSIKAVIEEKNPIFIIVTPYVFALRHFGYGLGAVWGLIKLLF